MEWLLHYAKPDLDWDYAMATLVIRFIGVFVVMLVMQVALQLSTRVIKAVERRHAVATHPTEEPLVSLDVSATAEHEAELDGAVLAAIAVAVELDGRPSRAAPVSGGTAGSSPWVMAGRLHMLGRRG